MASLEAWRHILPYCDYATKLSTRLVSSSLRTCADEALASGRLWATSSEDDDLVVRGEEGVLPSSYPDCTLPIIGASELLLPLDVDVSDLLPRFKQRTRVVANHYHDLPTPTLSSSTLTYDLRGRRKIGLTLDPFCDCSNHLRHDARDVHVLVMAPSAPVQDSPECGVAAGVLAPSVRRLKVEVEGDPADLVFASMAMFTKDVKVHPELEVEVVFRSWAPKAARRSTREMWAGYLGIDGERVRVTCEGEEPEEQLRGKRKRLENQEEDTLRKRRPLL
ncbi:hypothetical protein A1Q2_00579 [Trichosporon asahii var. asahii CBS 8904]|uniref:Uncharacterized protein n=1 Tax=Trichosporon asahii var. asahii (strain CBS 8904) TaxID=1220162 RepID=K1W8I3_TRIAC|nr:hypothetical protein A1Q2_00579 [Trichosporon asahii var. asahii CBS 8904]